MEMINSMLYSSALPNNLWGEALLSSCHILNRVPYKNYEKTPYELWKNRRPNLRYFKVWGYLAKIAVPPTKKTKLGSKVIDFVFIVYAQHNVDYMFFVIKFKVNEIDANTIIKCRDAILFEDVFPMKERLSLTTKHRPSI